MDKKSDLKETALKFVQKTQKTSKRLGIRKPLKSIK